MSTLTPPKSFPPGYLEQDDGYQIVAVVVAMIVLMTIATVFRFCSRCVQKKGLMWSDFFMPASLLCNLGLATSVLLAVRWGAGKHLYAVPLHDLRLFTIMCRLPIPLLYLEAVTFPRLSILDLYLNIFVDKPTRWISYSVGVVIILSMVVNFITTLTQCTPFSESWNPVKGGHCENIRMHLSYAGIPNIVTDVIILLLPIRAIWTLQTGWKTKLGINFTFVLGGLGLAASIARFVEFLKFSYNNSAADPTWQSPADLIWVMIEPAIYHICACLLTLRPLFRWAFVDGNLSSIFSRLRSSLGGSRNSTSEASRSGSSNGDYTPSTKSYKTESINSGVDDTSYAPRDQGRNTTSVVHPDLRDEEEGGREGIHVKHNVEVSTNESNQRR